VPEEFRHDASGDFEFPQKVVAYRERLIAALPEESRSLPNSLWTSSREGIESSISREERKIDASRAQIKQLKERFRIQLQQIGIDVFDDEIDNLLMP